MAEISAGLVKDLREKTGAGMMECKKALIQAEGDMEKAIKVLRESGAAKAAKREARTAAEGLVEFALAANGKSGALAELNSETDFVARNEEFQAVVKALAKAALDAKAVNAVALAAVPLASYGKTAGEVVAEIRAKIGEKIELKRAAYLEGDIVTGYLHPPGKIGVLIAAKVEGVSNTEAVAELLRGVAMHVAAINPRFLEESEIDEATAASERDIFTNIARKEGKPEAILPKIVEGKMKAFYKENCLVSQVYVRDGKATVKEVIDAAAKEAGGKVSVTRFIRFQVGEGAEKQAEE